MGFALVFAVWDTYGVPSNSLTDSYLSIGPAFLAMQDKSVTNWVLMICVERLYGEPKVRKIIAGKIRDSFARID